MSTPKSSILVESQESNCPECDKCLQVLQIVLDGEGSPEEATYVDHHIQSCPNCLDCYETDKALRETVKEKLTRKEVPYELIAFIKAKVSTTIRSGI
ncbi:MAG: hypothetical protein HC880_21590 [Bacteroidia bacterium]|nr:hypothetical protein [Bacteroidia bacterium]